MLLNRTMPIRAGLLFMIACVWSASIAAQECDELEGEDLTVCLTLMVCMALDEDRARNQCLEVARQVLDQHDAQKEPSKQEETVTDEMAESSSEKDVVEEMPSLVEEPVQDLVSEEERVSATSGISQSVQPNGSPDTTASRGSRAGRWFSWIRRGGGKSDTELEEEDIGVTKDGVPKQFAATVVTVTKAGYNDALVVLSNRYVFIVSRARESRIEPGDVIVARKKEGLSGRLSFLFYGRGASVDAHRVDCGHVDASRQTRRRCEFASRQLGTEAL